MTPSDPVPEPPPPEDGGQGENDALTPEEVAEGWILTCQALPQTRTIIITVDYDA